MRHQITNLFYDAGNLARPCLFKLGLDRLLLRYQFFICCHLRLRLLLTFDLYAL
ncbi:protein of unknown function (plasmid) [Cupriavidus taiwanensis]|uniref:Uncharacterized protein n=1 Tax=Cupriavidus taiwanensis TaxID=164546 RepID=A0A375EBG4_9BURK|nr:protein of unknown function [Cupriavidus taiwanensis]SOZ72079.1 protein of unknown function [Cupriavidus taiwanensis]SOZ74389.1 protein of unknown function [Cupriavidus taiwanensis]SPA11270.1 protein of unknown function [Cupriavidus taiwanensis]